MPNTIYDISKLNSKLDEIKNKMPSQNSFNKMQKHINYLGAIVMIASSITRFVKYNAISFVIDSFYSAFSVYLILFGILLFAAEWKFATMIKYFEFLVTDFGKAVFMLFIGVLLFDNQKKADLWASLTLSLFGLINLILICAGRGRKNKENPDASEEEDEGLLNKTDNDLETMSEKMQRERFDDIDKHEIHPY